MLTYPECAIATIIVTVQVPTLRPRQYAQVSKRVKTVQRAYGGSRCANCVRERIVRAFLVEEAKIVKRVRWSLLFLFQPPRESLLPRPPHAQRF